MSNGCPVNSCRSASPNRTLTPGWEGNSSNISQYTAFIDHRLVSHIQLLAILCTQTQISTSEVWLCVSCVCGVEVVRNAGGALLTHVLTYRRAPWHCIRDGARDEKGVTGTLGHMDPPWVPWITFGKLTEKSEMPWKQILLLSICLKYQISWKKKYFCQLILINW